LHNITINRKLIIFFLDTKEYIASATLESYAMGLSSVQVSSKEESLTSIYPELKAELNNIQLSVEILCQLSSCQRI
jgi:hypothetical protein